MSGGNVTINSTKGVSTLMRPKFWPGMLLHHEDLEQLGGYTRDLNRLLFKSLFGCGVVCGLVVTTEQKCGPRITVGAGLALTCDGNPIYLPKDQSVAIDEKCDPNLEGPLYVVLCGTVKSYSPRTSMCPSDDQETTSVCTREREGWEIRIVSGEPKCACRCKAPFEDQKETDCKCLAPITDCYADHYNGNCSCECEDCNGGCCDCVLLARLDQPDPAKPEWIVDHRVRRFVRPVLMRDPQVALEQQMRKDKEAQKKRNDEKRQDHERIIEQAQNIMKEREHEAIAARAKAAATSKAARSSGRSRRSKVSPLPRPEATS